MIEPKPAIVRPRVVVPGVGPTWLEDEVQLRLERGWTGVVVLQGRRGSGRTTALARVASVVDDESRVELVDGWDEEVIRRAARKLVIGSVPVPASYAVREALGCMTARWR